MNAQQLLLFFFSALGAFNGLVLSAYFAVFVKKKSRATSFLSALMLALSIRLLKSALVVFAIENVGFYVLIGMFSRVLIGPLLFLYVREATSKAIRKGIDWLWHLIAAVAGLLALWFLPVAGQPLKDELINLLTYGQWLIYLLLALRLIQTQIKALFQDYKKLNNEDSWLVNVTLGIVVIWLAYLITNYTQLIVGGWSFAMVFYLLLVIWLFKRRNETVFFEKQDKYANKRIDKAEAERVDLALKQLFAQQPLYTNSGLKISEVAKAIGVSSHHLSQVLNDNLQSSFSAYINAYRIEAAQKMIRTNELLTLEAIGNECGFKSNSAFYSAFKKFKGLTPAQYKKSLK